MIELIGNKIFLDNNYEIREYDTDNGVVRTLVSDECTQSLIYIDKSKRNQLALDYLEFYNLPIDLNNTGVEYLMLGGGAISYPHHYINTFKDKKMDIVEINSKCIEYAKKYFYLDELIENSAGRLNIIIDDAINYILNINKKYDYVLIDLFNGKEPIKEIYFEENLLNLKKILKNNGVMVINYIISDGNSSKDELNKIITIANNYKIITNNKYFNSVNNTGNIIIILSNNGICIPNDYDYIDITCELL